MKDLPTGIRRHSSRNGYEIRLRFKDPMTGESKRASAYAKNLIDAKSKLREMQNRIESSQAPVDKSVTLRTWAEHWLSEQLPFSNLKPNTLDLYRGMVTTHILPSTLANQRMSLIRPIHLSQFMHELSLTKGQSLQRNVFVVIKHLFRSAQQNGILSSSPVSSLALPRKPKQNVRFVSTADVETLMSTLKTSKYLPAVSLLLQTGIRRGELLGLSWSDVDLENSVIHIRFSMDAKGRRESPKTSRSVRTIDLNPKAQSTLRQLRIVQAQDRLRLGSIYNSPGWDPVFRNASGEPFAPRQFLRAIQLAAEKAGLESDPSKERIGIHTLRHYVATKLLEGGTEMYVVSRILGHESIKTTVDIYGHLQDHQRKAALYSLAK